MLAEKQSAERAFQPIPKDPRPERTLAINDNNPVKSEVSPYLLRPCRSYEEYLRDRAAAVRIPPQRNEADADDAAESGRFPRLRIG